MEETQLKHLLLLESAKVKYEENWGLEQIKYDENTLCKELSIKNIEELEWID